MRPELPDEITSEFDQDKGQEWLDQGNELYEQMLDELIEDFPGQIDDHAARLLYDGWFNSETDRVERAEIWFDFFDYTGLDWDDFDWDAWREWYES